MRPCPCMEVSSLHRKKIKNKNGVRISLSIYNTVQLFWYTDSNISLSSTAPSSELKFDKNILPINIIMSGFNFSIVIFSVPRTDEFRQLLM